MGRFFRALFYYVSGQFIWGAKSLERNPHVIEARYDSVIGKYRQRLAVVKDAVGGIVALREQRKMDLERLGEQQKELQETLEGAEALAADRAKKLKAQGKTDAEVQDDAEFKQYSSAYADAESSLQGVVASIDRVQRDIEKYEQQASDHVIQLQQMQREGKRIEGEKYETLVDVSMATQEREINDMVSGFATDGTAKELQSLRELRTKARGDAEVSRRLSGADANLQAAKLRAAAQSARAGSRLAAKLGLGVQASAEAPAAAAPAKTAETAAGAGGKGGSLPGASS